MIHTTSYEVWVWTKKGDDWTGANVSSKLPDEIKAKRPRSFSLFGQALPDGMVKQ